MIVVVTLGIAFVVVAFVAAPFFLVPRHVAPAAGGENPMPEPLRELLAEKETVYAAIQELDFDFKSGKLSAEDHQTLRQRHEAEAAVLLQRIDELQAQSQKTQPIGKARRERRTA